MENSSDSGCVGMIVTMSIFAFILFLLGTCVYGTISDTIETSENNKQHSEAINFFESEIIGNSKTNQLLHGYLNQSIKSKKIKKGLNLDGKFYCVFIKDNEIKPYEEINKMFDNKQTNDNTSSKVEYIFICEKKDHAFGSYSNGSSAYKVEDIVSVIDLADSTIFEIHREFGGEPPISITGDYNGRGQSKTESDYYTIINSQLKH